MTDKHTGKWELQRGINFTLCKREWAFLGKTDLWNIPFTQGFPWKIKAFSHLPPQKVKKTKKRKTNKKQKHIFTHGTIENHFHKLE